MSETEGSQYTVRFTAEARQDVRSARAWYHAISPALAEGFDADLGRAIDRILDGPERYAVVHRGRRRALLRRFDYSVIYQTVDDRIIIIAVMHCKLNPAPISMRSL